MAKLPAILWYPGDWMKAPDVRALSYAAKGLWFDMLCIMAEATPRGFLSLNALPIGPELLARMTGGEAPEVTRILTELESAGVFSRDRKGVIYNRRLVRDEENRAVSKKFGHQGGNPDLVENYNYQGYVYLLAKDCGEVKIGASINPVKRCQKIRSQERDPTIKLLAKMAVGNMGLEESKLHAKYSEYRTCGEWFNLPKADLDALIILFATSSPPPSPTPYPPPDMKKKMKLNSPNGEGPGGERLNGRKSIVAELKAKQEKRNGQHASE